MKLHKSIEQESQERIQEYRSTLSRPLSDLISLPELPELEDELKEQVERTNTRLKAFVCGDDFVEQ